MFQIVTSMSNSLSKNSSIILGSLNGCTPNPIFADDFAMLPPFSSNKHISDDWCYSSSVPTSQNAATFSFDILQRALNSICPYFCIKLNFLS